MPKYTPRKNLVTVPEEKNVCTVIGFNGSINIFCDKILAL